MNDTWFDYNFNKIKNQNCDFGLVTIHYIVKTIEDWLSDYNIILDEERFKELCYKAYQKINMVKFVDDSIENLLEEELLIT